MIRKLKNIVHWGLAILANILYGFPGKRLTVVGVTGTDGKTTTTSLIYHILNHSGHKAAMITTVGAYIDGEMHSTGFHVTTPSAFAIQKFLKLAADTNHEFAVVETSSHGIDQHRIWGIPYKAAAITNITHEHLDYHKTFEAYAATKMRFLNTASAAIVNLDDPAIRSRLTKLRNKVITYSRTNEGDLNPAKFLFETNLFGSFNMSNALAAIGVCRELGISDDQIRAGLKTFKAPLGRQDIVWDKGFKIMVDFAHTPNAVENILKEAKATNPARLIHLFGAPGRRDQAKRPLMGAASSKYADLIIVAPDDPRDEKISDINQSIRSGIAQNFTEGQNLFLFEDRKQAIEFALAQASPGDFVVLTGKGHEATLAVGDQEIPWNEQEIALEILSRK